jgi:integrase
MEPIPKIGYGLEKLREKAEFPGLRFHDLRHTIITELAEMGVPDHVMESISGHLSRRMLERYSHIRLDAKRRALDELYARSSEAAREKPAKASNQ